MWKLYEIFNVLHFQKKNSFLGDYSRKYCDLKKRVGHFLKFCALLTISKLHFEELEYFNFVRKRLQG